MTLKNASTLISDYLHNKFFSKKKKAAKHQKKELEKQKKERREEKNERRHERLKNVGDFKKRLNEAREMIGIDIRKDIPVTSSETTVKTADKGKVTVAVDFY